MAVKTSSTTNSKLTIYFCPLQAPLPRAAAFGRGQSAGTDTSAQVPPTDSAAEQLPLGPGRVAADVPLLVSGAGHDALAMAELTRIGMLFVRCQGGGISHSPEEAVDDADVAAAAAALYTYLLAELQ